MTEHPSRTTAATVVPVAARRQAPKQTLVTRVFSEKSVFAKLLKTYFFLIKPNFTPALKSLSLDVTAGHLKLLRILSRLTPVSSDAFSHYFSAHVLFLKVNFVHSSVLPVRPLSISLFNHPTRLYKMIKPRSIHGQGM
jgi:hypothetical protein